MFYGKQIGVTTAKTREKLLTQHAHLSPKMSLSAPVSHRGHHHGHELFHSNATVVAAHLIKYFPHIHEWDWNDNGSRIVLMVIIKINFVVTAFVLGMFLFTIVQQTGLPWLLYENVHQIQTLIYLFHSVSFSFVLFNIVVCSLRSFGPCGYGRTMEYWNTIMRPDQSLKLWKAFKLMRLRNSNPNKCAQNSSETHT